jgi:sugar lactone lactonase YvrE
MRVSHLAPSAALLLGCVFFTALASAHPGSGIVVDEKGRVFFTDTGNPDASFSGHIWAIDAQGRLSSAHKTGAHWLALDKKGSYTSEDLKNWWDKRITMNFERVPLPDSKGALLQADGAPFVVAGDGNLYWAKGNLEIARLSPEGKVTLLGVGLKETTEKLGGIKGLACGPDGSLYASCPSAVLKIKPDGKVTTLVHPIVLKDVDTYLPKGAPEDQKPYLRGLAVDSRGNVYAAGTGCRCVVKVAPDGKAEVVLKAESPWSPTGVAVHGGDIYVLEYADANGDDHDAWLPRVRKLGRDGKVTTLATVTKKDRER